MSKTKSKTLDIICNLANTYKINPHKVIGLYNRAMGKPYTENQVQAMYLVKRYVKMNFEPRYDNVRWEHIQIIDFRKTKVGYDEKQ